MHSTVADTTPLNYLVLIQAADILPTLYGRVINAQTRVERPRMKLVRGWRSVANQPGYCRKQYAHRYAAHQDANDALQRP